MRQRQKDVQREGDKDSEMLRDQHTENKRENIDDLEREREKM